MIDDVAYFGMSPPMERQSRDGPNVQCDVVAVNLVSQELLFRHQVHTHGLLNVVSAPHLAEASTYIAQGTPAGRQKQPALVATERQQIVSKKVQAEVTIFKTTETDDRTDSHLDSGTVDSSATVEQRLSTRWSESWLNRPLDVAAVNGQWPTSMPRMDLTVKGKVLDSGMGRRHGYASERGEKLPVYVHLGKVAPELIDPAKVCQAAPSQLGA